MITGRGSPHKRKLELASLSVIDSEASEAMFKQREGQTGSEMRSEGCTQDLNLRTTKY